MKAYLRKIGWTTLALVLILGLVLSGIQLGSNAAKVTDIPSGNARQILATEDNYPTFRLGNPVYGATSVDYTLDGTDDNVQFQAALDALPATGGQLLVVSSGTISFSATVSRAINNVSIVGMGYGTYFTYNGSDPIFSAGSQSGWTMTNFRTDDGSVTYLTSTKYNIDILVNVTPLKATDAGIAVANVTDSALTSGRVPIASTNGLLTDDAQLTFTSATNTLSSENVTVTSLTDGRDVVVTTGGILSDKIISGTTFPVSPKTGDMFLHAPTGRKWLYQYDGATWRTIKSFGTCTVYVDPTGTDDLEHGTATGTDAFATIQYAIDAVPVEHDASPNIQIAAGTYHENLSAKGHKWNENNSNLKLTGATNQLLSTTATGGTQGSGATVATVTGTFTADAYNNKIIHFTSGSNDGLYRIIGDGSTTTLYLVGVALNAAPSGGDTYEILDLTTHVDSISMFDGEWLLAYFIDFTGDSYVGWGTVYGFKGSAKFFQCFFTNNADSQMIVSADGPGSFVSLFQCYFKTHATGYYIGIGADWTSNINVENCKIEGYAKASGSGLGMRSNQNASICAQANDICNHNIGALTSDGGTINMYGNTVKSFIHGNYSYGVESTTGGIISSVTTTYVVYGKLLDNSTSDTNGADYIGVTWGTQDAAVTSNSGAMGALTATSVTDSGLTSGQIPVAGTGGLLGNGPKWSSAMDTSLAKAVHKTITAGVVKAGKYFVIPLDSDSGAAVTDGFDPGSNFTIGTLYNGIRANASGCDNVTLVDSDVSPTFTTNLYKLCGGADQYCFIKWSSDSGYTADTGYGWATYVDANTLTLFKSTGADFANNYYYWIYASYYTAPVTGYYQINGMLSFSDCEDGKRYVAALMVNGLALSIASQQAAASSSVLSNAYSVVYHFTAGDIVLLVGTTIGATDSVCYVDKARLSSLTLRCIKLD